MMEPDPADSAQREAEAEYELSVENANNKWWDQQSKRAIRRKKWSPRRKRSLTPQERQAYQLATERARTPFGFLQCEQCSRSLLDGQEQRHHKTHRSGGGETTQENIAVLCLTCHFREHNIRIECCH
jgi:5-methylcytosine-specific restriction endonuclease McrA